MIGFAISDIGNKFFDLFYEEKVIELQPESLELLGIIKERKDNLSFLSMHLPCQGNDITSFIESFRKRSVKRVKEVMKYANSLNANVVVLHPGHIYDSNNAVYRFDNPYTESYFWNNLNDRFKLKEKLIKSLKDLFNFYNISNFSFYIGIENLEFPKLAFSLNELKEIFIYAKDIASNFSMEDKIKVVIDIPHLWHSRKLVLENYYKLPSSITSQVFPLFDQYKYLSSLYEYFSKDEICLFHLAHCIGHKTHEKIPLKEIFNENELDLNKVVNLIKGNVILEVFSKVKETGEKEIEERITLEDLYESRNNLLELMKRNV